MADGIYWTDFFAKQTCDIAGSVDGNGVERTYESGLLRANGYAGSTVDASIPAYVEKDGLQLAHIFLYSDSGLK